MNILEYQQEVKRTMPDLGSKILNSIHMTLGMASEALEELDEAIINKDEVNISEELADIQWYALNYATLHEIDLSITAPYNFSFEKSLGKICDIDKKEFVYKKETDENERSEHLRAFILWTEIVAHSHSIDMDIARQRVIDKLMLRYPDKFDADKAINRDVKKERVILEGGKDEN